MDINLNAANIFLIGYRCTGKTSVGRDVAKKIGWRFVDTDERIMEKTGETVVDIVSRSGWKLFRKLEKETMKDVCRDRQQVVATGGGVVTEEENIDIMKRSGAVVWLKATTDTILKRTTGDAKSGDLRPSLTNRDLREEIEETLNYRLPMYEDAMTMAVDTEGKTLSEVTGEVIERLASSGFVL